MNIKRDSFLYSWRKKNYRSNKKIRNFWAKVFFSSFMPKNIYGVHVFVCGIRLMIFFVVSVFDGLLLLHLHLNLVKRFRRRQKTFFRGLIMMRRGKKFLSLQNRS